MSSPPRNAARRRRVTTIVPPQQDDPPVRYRQGVVVAADELAGTNVVAVGGHDYYDLPTLVPLTQGQNVVVLRTPGGWFVVGEPLPAGSPLLHRGRTATTQINASTGGWGLTTVLAVLATAQVEVPAWATEAVVHASAAVAARNPTAVTDTMHVDIRVAGLADAVIPVEAATLRLATGPAVAAATLATPVSPLVVDVRARSVAAAWAAHADNRAHVTAMITFRNTL